MSSPNPYESPTSLSPSLPVPPTTLTFAKALGYLLVSTALFALLGSIAGLIIATVIPQYYVAAVGASSPSQAIAAGTALGVVQGGSLGVVAGLGLVAIIAWVQLRLRMIETMREKDPR